jgi:biopolymer transport protein ExbD
MPIHVPGSRLYSSIPFKHLANKHAQGRRSPVANLNLTAMVDMMTMLVVFLLSTFSATGELLLSQKGVILPEALNDKDLQRAPIISITHDEIAFKGDRVASTTQIAEEEPTGEWKIVELYDKLELARAEFERQDIEEKKKEELRGLIILQADKAVDAKVLNRVMKTAYAAQYTNVMFAISKKAKGK